MSGSFPTSVGIREEQLEQANVILVTTTQSLLRQVRERPGHCWKINIQTIPLDEDVWRELEGFIVSQRGPYGTFTYIMESRGNARGAGGGIPKVKGGSQSGRAPETDGWPNNTMVLKGGDLVKFNGHSKVYMQTVDVTSNGSGEATLTLEPELFESPADNEDIVINNVPFTVSLVQNVPFRADVAKMVGLDLEFIETL